ncbi:hypothetical protein V1522DRAFT_416602 [Lipomyces starkeyi]
MKLHLQKHGITNGFSVSAPGHRSISAIWKHRAELSYQARLERNLLRWTVTELQPFAVIERPTYFPARHAKKRHYEWSTRLTHYFNFRLIDVNMVRLLHIISCWVQLPD